MTIYHIIGAGVSGLTLAYELAKGGAQVRIYEKLGLPGGLARTENFNGERIDCGPHLYHTNNKEIREYWQRLPGMYIAVMSCIRNVQTMIGIRIKHMGQRLIMKPSKNMEITMLKSSIGWVLWPWQNHRLFSGLQRLIVN